MTKAGDPEVRAIHDKYKRGKLILQPDFQRQFVWDRKKSSRLIESIPLSVPLPIIYLSEQPDGKEYVIDGQQRLTSLFSFIDGRFPSGDEFRLIGLSAYKELNKSSFKEIAEQIQDKILNYSLRSVTRRQSRAVPILNLRFSNDLTLVPNRSTTKSYAIAFTEDHITDFLRNLPLTLIFGRFSVFQLPTSG